MNAAMTFLPDGSAQCLYHELIDLHRLGTMQCRRASCVEFDEPTQQWQVFTADFSRLLFSHAKREVCLEWEQENIEKLTAGS
jgi:hypothetical protein